MENKQTLNQGDTKMTTSKTLTEKETFLLTCIAESEYRDGSDNLRNEVWSDTTCDTYATKHERSGAGGVMSSLVKKGLVLADAIGSRDACVCLTSQGVEAYNEIPKS